MKQTDWHRQRRDRLRPTLHAAAIALLAVTLGACDLAFSSYREEATDVWTKTYPIAESGRIEVMNTNGHVRVEASDRRDVEVHAERVAKAATQEAAKELLTRVEIVEDISPDRIRIETKRPPSGGWGRGSVEVRYTLRVPKAVQVDLQTTNGAIAASGVSGGARLTTTNGGIDGLDLGGEVRAETTNGHVNLELASVSQPVRIATTNGGVTLKIPATSKADVSASLTNGAIQIEGLGLEADGEITRRRVNGRLNGGGPRIEVTTTNGGIEIQGRPGT